MRRPLLILALICLLVGVCCLSSAENEAAPQPELILQPTELRVNKGTGGRVTVNVINIPRGVGRKNFEWSSSNPEVAIFNGGVRGVGAGEAILTCTATLTDGTTLSAECAVTVVVPVARIQCASRNLTVMAGDTLTPEIQVFPEDATNQRLQFSSSDEKILSVSPEGQITAVAEGKVQLTVEAEENPTRRIRVPVTVTKRIGKADREITFQGIPWGSDCETCIRRLKETGLIAEEVRPRFSYTTTAWHWPEDDLLFSRLSEWRMLPDVFAERQAGVARTSLKLLKTIGGYQPKVSTLVYFNQIGPDGQIIPDSTSLTGVYFSFEGGNEGGADIFRGLMGRLEEAYGTFNRYLSSDIPRYYKELDNKIKDVMADAKTYGLQDLGEEVYLGEYAICTIYGSNHTGIMLSIDTNETVTLFYGKTDAADLIRALQETETMQPIEMEDAGV